MGLSYKYIEDNSSSSSDAETEASDSPTEASSSQTEISENSIPDVDSDASTVISDRRLRWHIDQMNALDAELHRDLAENGPFNADLEADLDADFERGNIEEDPRVPLTHAWFYTRAAELVKVIVAQQDETQVTIRNEGNIIEDLNILEFMQTEAPDRYDSIREGFEALYEISLQYKSRIIAAPDAIKEVFNDLADTKSCWEWIKDPVSQEEAQKVCRTVIDRWIEYVDGPEGEILDDDIRRILFA